MFIWRNALILGGLFVVIGLLYLLLQQYTPTGLDQAGVVLLVVLGLAMSFTFLVLLRGSREL
jgi:C4-dicarboxylate transporter